ncbi:MAG: putative lipid II flippase FtsW [Alphaproteobacteria bacterium]|nr:putative lipid II flippase FtsW [Alphaproteobacteria bacterium]NCQ66665.1 putative lipid II flippase FtsW [Alphaproteobacteria bacterium]NCT07116.1 putative lipid II flippase FtsW [Alphaproteobacteria bacterium]
MARVAFARTDNSVLTQWWWSVDRWLFLGISILVAVGIMLVMAASPPVAERIGLDSFYFVKRHLVYVAGFFVVTVGVSQLSQQSLRRAALLLYLGALVLLILTPFIGNEIKGARRWVSLGGFSIQPSEFMKPALVVMTAWMLSEKKKNVDVPGNIFAIIFYSLAIGLLLLQPDMGMVFLMTAIFFAQFFLAGLPLFLIVIASATGIVGMVSAYFLFPHVQSRVDRFLTPGTEDRFSERYQITQSLEAFSSGGFWGLGPGEGIVKKHLPDAHADFIFSVAAEEYGVFLCLIIALLFGFFVIRSILKVMQEQNLFILLAVSGLALEIGVQATINMASTLDLIPTKGMTLPFMSFGGSSILSIAISCGFILALTRRQVQGRI